tara:strand:- start:69 stop:1184 length:1116 start_codon:yes stop_codon:yes gene_type:complete
MSPTTNYNLMNNISADYFDGLTSNSSQSTLSYNKKSNEFIIEIQDGNSFNWKLKDLQFNRYKNLIEIRNKKYSDELLKVNDASFADEFYTLMRKNKRVDLHSLLLNLSFSKIFGIAIFLFFLLGLSYFYIIPPLAEKSVDFLPESFDNQIGNMVEHTFVKYLDINEDKTIHINQFVSELNLGNSKPLNFNVINSKQVNAFAIPNGKIFIFSGILDKMEDYDELSALIGHEVSHINFRHSAKMLSSNIAGYLLISLMFSDINGIMSIMLDNAHQLNSLSFSRKHEKKADEEGLNILIKNNIDPNGMINLFKLLKEEEEKYTLNGYELSGPEITSSHPLTQERINNIENIISKSDYKIIRNKKLNKIFKKLKN